MLAGVGSVRETFPVARGTGGPGTAGGAVGWGFTRSGVPGPGGSRPGAVVGGGLGLKDFWNTAGATGGMFDGITTAVARATGLSLRLGGSNVRFPWLDAPCVIR